MPSTSKEKRPLPFDAVFFPPETRTLERNLYIHNCEDDEKYEVMCFNGGLRELIEPVYLEREDNSQEFFTDGAQFGAGSTFNNYLNRKKFGKVCKQYEPGEQPWKLQLGNGKKYKGFRQGGINEHAKYYMFQQQPNGDVIAYPLDAWYNFRATQRFQSLSVEEAECEFKRHEGATDKKYNKTDDTDDGNKPQEAAEISDGEWMDAAVDDLEDNEYSSSSKVGKKGEEFGKPDGGCEMDYDAPIIEDCDAEPEVIEETTAKENETNKEFFKYEEKTNKISNDVTEEYPKDLSCKSSDSESDDIQKKTKESASGLLESKFIEEMKRKAERKTSDFDCYSPAKYLKIDDIANNVFPENESYGITEEIVRRYLARKPWTTTELLTKLKKKFKKTDVSNEVLAVILTQVLNKINPEKLMVHGKLYFSINNDN